MLMQAIAQGGCADTLRESALVRQDFEPASVRCSTNWTIPPLEQNQYYFY